MNKRRRERRGVDCRSCQNGYRNLRKMVGLTSSGSDIKGLPEPNRLRIFRKTQVVRDATVQRLHEQFADGIRNVTYSAPPSLERSSPPTTKSAMKKGNRGAIDCASVGQGSVTQWIQSYPCKTTNPQETARNLRKFPSHPPKIRRLCTLIKLVKILNGTSVRLPHGSETNGIEGL